MATTTMQEDQEAKANARAIKNPTNAKRAKMRFKHKFLLIVVSLGLMALLRTGFMFVIIGLLPSIVAYYIDITTSRYAFRTIFACNLSGLLPSIGQMLHTGPSSALLQNLMGSLTNWVTIYGAALIGWLLVEICPMISHMLIVSANKTKISRIARLQKKIEEEWGPEVTQLANTMPAEDEE